MAFIFTNLPAETWGRRPLLEDYLNQLPTAAQEQLATDAGISFTPSNDIDVATQDDYIILAVEADAVTAVEYTTVDAAIRDKYEEASIEAERPERKWALVQGTAAASTGPVFTISSEVVYLELMIENYPDWAKLVYSAGITAGIRDTDAEDFAMKLSGSDKNFMTAAVPTASYGSDVATGLFTVADDAEYKGIMDQVFSIIKKKK